MNKKVIVAIDLSNLNKAITLVRRLKKEVFAFKIGHEFFYNFGIEGYKRIIVALDLDNINKAIKLVKKLKKEAYAFKIGHEFFYNFGISGYKKIYRICPKIFVILFPVILDAICI